MAVLSVVEFYEMYKVKVCLLYNHINFEIWCHKCSMDYDVGGGSLIVYENFVSLSWIIMNICERNQCIV